MGHFFSLDGLFNKYGGFLADMLILSLMWLLFSIPIFTIGASTSALFYVSTRRIANREGYITSDFWTAFKANFIKANVLWLILLMLGVLYYINIVNIEVVGAMRPIILPAQFIFMAIMLLMSVYIFPLAARFDMGIVQIIKSSFYMANRHLLTSITCVILLAASGLFAFIFIPAIFFMPGAYAMLASHLLMKVFKKYRPEMDRDPVLEIQEIEAKKAEDRRLAAIGSSSQNEDEKKTEEPSPPSLSG